MAGIKVEPYSIHGSFLKLEYLKTEFNEDNGTYAIVKVTSHRCQMVNLSISDYLAQCGTLKEHIWMCFFLCKMSRLTLYLKMGVYHMIIHVFGKVQGPTSTGNLHDGSFKNVFECSHKPQNF